MNQKPRVAISIGDVNGVGPEIILKSFQEKERLEEFTPIVFGGSRVLSFYRKKLGLTTDFVNIKSLEAVKEGRLNILEIEGEVRASPKEVSKEAGKFAFLSLQAAARAVKEGDADVLVTAPINKDNIQSEEFNFPGHTEYLESVWEGSSLMFMVHDSVKVGLVTQHIPLEKVKQEISFKSIFHKVKLIEDTLKKDYRIEKPKIAVLGLNPHAGNNGLLGTEEKELIVPVIQKLDQQNVLAFGPYSADSFFTPENLSRFDAVLAMYHDQGLIPFKTLTFGSGVNFTAGLEFIRTSPDHGVAYDIAGEAKANEDSFLEAVYLSLSLYRNRANYQEITANPLKVEVRKNSRYEK